MKSLCCNKLQVFNALLTISVFTAVVMLHPKTILVASAGDDIETEASHRNFLKDYRGDVKLPAELLAAYAGFAKWTKQPKLNEFTAHALPQSVNITTEQRAEKGQEYGQDINLPFLKSSFKLQILNLRKENDDCYLIRTASSALWFVNSKSGWKLYRYFDKPIE